MAFFNCEEILEMQVKAKSELPSNIAPLIGTRDYGPNCWNATIVWHEPNSAIRYTEPMEMEDWLAYRTVEVDPTAGWKYGDIMVLRTADGDLVHTAICLDEPNVFFHKIGFAGPWVVQTFDQMMQVYAYDYSGIQWRRYVGAEQKAA